MRVRNLIFGSSLSMNGCNQVFHQQHAYVEKRDLEDSGHISEEAEPFDPHLVFIGLRFPCLAHAALTGLRA